MFPRFLFESSARISGLRAGRLRGRRPDRRPPVQTGARFHLEGLEVRCLLSGVSGITEFTLPGPQSSLTGITAGPDGNIWFTDRGSNAIGMINPTTDAISLFTVPTANCWPFGITVGSNGNLWFTEAFATGGGKIGEINPTTHVISEFALPTVSNGGNEIRYPRGITAGPSGNLWFAWQGTGAGAIGEINPTNGAITVYPIDYKPYFVAAGPDGNIWFTGAGGAQVGQFNPTTDAVTFFDTPSGSAAYEITAGPDGNMWFTGNGQIGQVNLATDVITEYTIPYANSGNGEITAGPDGNLWFTDVGTGSIGTFNLNTDAIIEYRVPYVNTNPLAITAGPDGNIWFTDPITNAIGVATLTTSQLVVTQPPPASVTAGSPFGLTVEAEDSSGNPITSFNGTVTVALGANPGGATLGGTLTATASNGVATFSGLTLTKAAAGYTLDVSGSGLGEGVTNAMTVTPAAATQLVITQQPPATVKVNTAFGLQASIEDQYGNVVTTAGNTVSVAFANNPTGATLSGTLSVTASSGVTTFSGLAINKTGSGYTLKVSSSGLSSAVTNAISVTKTGTSSAVVVQSGSNVPVSLLAPLVLDSPDLWDIPGLKRRTRST